MSPVKLILVQRQEVFAPVGGVSGQCFAGLSVKAKIRCAGKTYTLAFFHPYFPKRLWSFTQKVAEAKLLKQGSLPREIRDCKVARAKT